MLICTIIVYNDFPLIQQTIESVINKVDRIVIVDGKYKDFPGGNWDSIDGTLEYLQTLDVDILSTIGFTEIDKRNLYLQQLNEGDTVLNLDADEVLIGEIPELNADWGIINLYDGHGRHIQHRASRFFRYKEGIHYQNTHCTLYTSDGIIINKLHQVVNPEFSFELIKEFYIEHNWHMRSSERQYYKTLYYKKLVQIEAGFVK